LPRTGSKAAARIGLRALSRGLPPQPKTVTALKAMISDEAGSEGRISQLLTLNGLCGCRRGPRHSERAADSGCPDRHMEIA